MPLGPDEQRIADRLTALYRASEQRLLDQLADAATSPAAARRLRALLREHRREAARIRQGTRAWITRDLPDAYTLGGAHAADTLGTVFSWTQTHREAIQALAAATWDDVAATLADMEASTARGIRRLLDDDVRSQLLEGITGRRGADDLGRAIARETGILRVTYADGSTRSIVDYADTLSRTSTALTRNAGELNLSRAEGVTHMECFDGADCQLETHDSGGLANGLVVPIEVAEQHPIAHPRCARLWSPRPDVTTPEEAEAARRYDPDTQERMAVEERDRARRETVEGFRPGRFARAPRLPRSPRAPRTSRT